MNSTQAVSANENSVSAFFQVLGNPWFDRSIAFIACVPFAWYAYYRYKHAPFNLVLIAFWIQIALLTLPMLVRTPPKRVTPNPAYWFLAFLATYWLLMPILASPGRSLVSNLVSNSLAICSLLIAFWARISLGRSIGFVPAQRQLVAHGAYKYVRHPIYTSIFLTYLGFALRVEVLAIY